MGSSGWHRWKRNEIERERERIFPEGNQGAGRKDIKKKKTEQRKKCGSHPVMLR